MSEDEKTSDAGVTNSPSPAGRELTPQARRALAEAAERRALSAAGQTCPCEVGGRKGPDPVRYGDWEKGGIASDF